MKNITLAIGATTFAAGLISIACIAGCAINEKAAEQTASPVITQYVSNESIAVATVETEFNKDPDGFGLTGSDYGERTEEDMMRDEMNAGYTGSDYGERTEEEMAEDDKRAAQAEAENKKANTAAKTTKKTTAKTTAAKKVLTGRDYGERTEAEMAEDDKKAAQVEAENEKYGINQPEAVEETVNTDPDGYGLTGRDYGERSEEDMMRDEMNNGYTGADYGENA